jgi:hypothetical protein
MSETKLKPYPITEGHLADLRIASINSPSLQKILKSMEDVGFEITPEHPPGQWKPDYSVMFMYPGDIVLGKI